MEHRNSPFRLSVITDEISQNPEEAVALAKRYGYDGLEIRSVWDKPAEALSDEQLIKLKELAQDNHMEISAISTSLMKTEYPADEHEKFRQIVRVCNILGCKRLRGFSFWRSEDYFDEGFAEILKRYDRELGELGLEMVLENDPSVNLSTASELARFFSKYSFEHIGILWDPGNEIYTEGATNPYPEGYIMVAPYVRHVHIKDAKRVNGEVIATAVGYGAVPYPEQLDALRRNGYQGWLVLETHYKKQGHISEELLKRPGGSSFSENGAESSEECMQNLNEIISNLSVEYHLGVVGTESAHAKAFIRFFNLPDPETGKVRYPNIRVTQIWGDPDSAAKLLELSPDLVYQNDLEEMACQVDGVMITARRGSDHNRLAQPFVKRGMPVFVDKPFTANSEEGRSLYREAKACGCRIMGGSSCRFADGLSEIKQLCDILREKGEFMGAAMNYFFVPDSEYDGIFFYAPHLVEMCLTAFGDGILGVTATKVPTGMIVTCRYPKDGVSLHFCTAAAKDSCMVFSKWENHTIDISITPIFSRMANQFAQMVLGEWNGMTEEELIFPVRIVEAISRSLECGREILL